MDGVFYLGVLAGLGAGLLWSLGPGVIGRFAPGYRSVEINFYRSLYAVLFLLVIIPLLGYSFTVDPRGILVIYVSAFFGPLLGDTLYIASIKRIGGGNAVSIGYTYIFFAQLYSHILYGEPTTPSLAAGTIIALYGIHLVYSGEKGRYEGRGFLAALGAALSWGMGAALSKLALLYGPPIPIAFYRNLSVTVTLLPLVIHRLGMIREKPLTIMGLITGGLGFGIGMPLFLYAISTIGVGVTVLATSITPVLGRIIAKYIAGEKPSWKAYVGTMITAIGIIVGLTPIYP